ncbi:hypothetical protein Tco_1387498 [Tanacetum coccineum]
MDPNPQVGLGPSYPLIERPPAAHSKHSDTVHNVCGTVQKLPSHVDCLKGYPLAGQHTTLQSVGNSLTSNVKDNGISMSTSTNLEVYKSLCY